MWMLKLNMMRGRAEEMHVVAVADTKEELVAFLQRERVEPYTDSSVGGHGNEFNNSYRFSKSFRKGGPLEWYNPPILDYESFIDFGTREDHVQRAAESYDAFVNQYRIPPGP